MRPGDLGYLFFIIDRVTFQQLLQYSDYMRIEVGLTGQSVNDRGDINFARCIESCEFVVLKVRLEGWHQKVDVRLIH